MVAGELTLVKNNLLVTRMDVAGLTQRGSSWPRERVCGRGDPVNATGMQKIADSKELWKSGKAFAEVKDRPHPTKTGHHETARSVRVLRHLPVLPEPRLNHYQSAIVCQRCYLRRL